MLLRRVLLLAALVPLAACEPEGESVGDSAWFRDKSWEDGAAVVSVFRGRIKWYDQWRDAEIRHYAVREFMDRTELTKDEPPQDDSLPVLKVNVLISFTTGTYPYRQMCSLFFDRATGALVKAVGSSQEACGASFQRWDRSGRLSYDTYWSGEGSGSRELKKGPGAFFVNELPVVAGMLAPQEVELLPSLVRSSVRDRSRAKAQVTRDGRETKVGDRSYVYDADGFLERWTVPGSEEFRRVSKKRLYYWLHHGVGDEKLLEGN